MNESGFWNKIRKGLKDPPDVHLVRIENAVYSGTPDVSYCINTNDASDASEGFMELKYIKEWPKRATTIVRVPHFTPAQRTWLHDRHIAGGNCFVCLGVGKSVFLFDGIDAAMKLGKDWNKEQMCKYALEYWDGNVDWKQFKWLLTHYPNQ
jgi:hypothetical protein